MPDLSSLPVAVVVVLGILLLLWFAAGTQWNVGRGQRILRWLQPGLPQLAERTTLRWLGSSAVEMQMSSPKAPFREATLVLVMEPRDVPLMWAWSRLRGRRDLLILRGRLRHPPRLQLELLDARSWTGREALRSLDRSAWLQSEAAPAGLTLLHGGDTDPSLAAPLLEQLQQISPYVARLSVQRTPPHFQAHMAIPDLAQVSGKQFVEILRQVGTNLSSGKAE
jgi:hypothetical protein